MDQRLHRWHRDTQSGGRVREWNFTAFSDQKTFECIETTSLSVPIAFVAQPLEHAIKERACPGAIKGQLRIGSERQFRDHPLLGIDLLKRQWRFGAAAFFPMPPSPFVRRKIAQRS